MFDLFNSKLQARVAELTARNNKLVQKIAQLQHDLDNATKLIESSKFKRAEQLSDTEMERQQANAEQVLFLKVEITRLKRSVNHVIEVLNSIVNPDCATDLSDQLMVQVQDESRMYGGFPIDARPK